MLNVKKTLTKVLTKLTNPTTTRRVTVSISKQSGSSASIQAPSVTGYYFVCWIGVATAGWVGSVYVQSCTAQSTNVWNTTNLSGTGNVEAVALYMKA